MKGKKDESNEWHIIRISGGIIISSEMKALPSHLHSYAAVLDKSEYIRGLVEGPKMVENAILHHFKKFKSCVISESDTRDVIIEHILKEILMKEYGDEPQMVMTTLIEIKNARLEQNTQNETFEDDLRFSFDKAGLGTTVN